ncbi:hypothetical protein [Geodermatophilus normandii]|uniref:hypothetical protein n=1 Tax=Geodermatophilus normandii TaxID=1137989 RepID=UPI001EF8D3BF|nr:hypothetical protein [Geodermatophilus normandii]
MPAPSVVLSLDVGSSSLKAAVRGPDLRVRAEVSGLRDDADAEPAHVTVQDTGSAVEHARLSGGWAGWCG